MNYKLITLFFVSCFVFLATCKKIEKEILVSTGEINSITTNTAVASGELVDLGPGVTQHGHCWATTQNVSTSSSKTQLGIPAGTGGFTSILEGLEAGSKYYIKAFATDGVNTVYGKEINFTTVAASVPVLTTTVISSITATTAGSGGNITSEGGAPVTARGVCWGITSNPTTANSKTSDGSGSGNFASSITNLSSGTIYYVRAYATNIAGTAYGNELSFTSGYLLPTLTTSALTSVTSNSASSGGNITNDGGASVTARGVCWSTITNPTIEHSKTIDGEGTGAFISSITGLTPGTTYYVRAYATNSAGTAYGNEVICNASSVLPTLTTTAISSITSSTAISGGNITNDGGAAITGRGVCWGTTTNPDIAGSKTSDNTGAGSFTSNVTGLTPGVTYYVRAYATNNAGTAYGNEISFAASAIIPSVTTTTVSNITATTAVSGGNITSDGGASVTERGICWSTSANPSIDNNTIAGASGTGSFVSSITGLTSNTTYYVRAYAKNSIGIAYGTQVSFTTTIILPVVTTDAISAITATNATSGGTVTSEGGAPVTSRGVCWGTTSSPTLDNSKTTDGLGTGAFISSLTGLIHGTTYYVRAYATNSGGTSFGNEISFIAAIELPTLTTLAISNITSTTANSGGSITNDGGATVTARGVCWSTSPNPTTSNDNTTDATGTGSFVSNVTSLNPNTTYNVRAYATNAVGTSYGNVIIFKTWTGTVSDIDGNVYNTVTIGSQIWITENLKTTKYNDNTSIPLITDITAWAALNTPALCWYFNDEATYKNTYGALYNWYAIDALTNGGKNVCPVGWHVSSDAEWTTLTDFLGGESIAGGKLKETGTTHWQDPNTGATDEVLFTALPGGYRSYNVSYTSKGIQGFWWSSTQVNTIEAWYRDMNYGNIVVRRGDGVGTSKKNGLSVRCIKD
jgi:uncharacterized protein (TIGR02145 family)